MQCTRDRAEEDDLDCAIIENIIISTMLFSSLIITILVAPDDFVFLTKALITASLSKQSPSQTLFFVT